MDTTAADFIEARRWRFASTMPDWPHEYTVKSWAPDEPDAFVAFCELIQERGAVEPWPPLPAEPLYHNRYLAIGDHKYWAMGPKGDRDAVEEMTVINRTIF
jgi:hypothetical protein